VFKYLILNVTNYTWCLFVGESYTTGSRELDKLIGELPPRTMLLIAGHPGAGKTTLASQICYANALRGKKCLYITFYEDKDKLYRNMGRLGINLAEVESKGLLTYVKLPVSSTEGLLNAISDILAKGHYDVVVVDSINPALELLERIEAQRAILLNFFYQLTSLINGLLVTVAEVPLGKEYPDIGSMEFVPDAILYVKHRMTRGLLHRALEIRKLRGAPLAVVEVPFSIIGGGGFKAYIPPKPERVLSSREEALGMTISVVKELIGPLYKGDVLYVSYPPHARDPVVTIPLIDLAITNSVRVLFVSYKYSSDEVLEVLTMAVNKYLGLSLAEASELISKCFHLESINPASYAVSHLHALTVELVDDLRPSVVVFHGTEVFRAISDPQEYWGALINELTWFKNIGKLVVRYGSRVDPYWTRMNEAVSDAVIRLYYKRSDKQLTPLCSVWRRGRSPAVISLDGEVLRRIEEDLNKLANIARERIAQ